MKVKNVSTKRIFIDDLKPKTDGQGDNRYLDPGTSAYLPDTSEVLRSAQKGDIKKWKAQGVLQIDDVTPLTAAPGPGNSVTITHNLNYLPDVRCYKQAGATWVDATGIVDIVHDAAFTTTTVTNMSAFALTFMIKVS